MAVTLKGNSGTYEGTSEDNKPLDVPVNTEFDELDTGKTYYFDGETWNEEPPCEGGGFTPTAEQLAAMNSGITAEDVAQISTNENNISSIKTTTLTLATEQGSLDYATGAPINATNRVRTITPIPVGEIFRDGTISAGSNYLLIARIYDIDGTYIVGCDEARDITYAHLTDSTNYVTWNRLSLSQQKIIINGEGTVRFIIKNTTNTDITPSDVELVYTYNNSPYKTIKSISDFAVVNDGSIICKPGTYYISSSIAIDTAEIKLFDGNGATFIVASDIPAFIVQGTMNVSSASPLSLPSGVYREMGTVIENLSISSTGAYGTGFEIKKCFGLNIKNCTIRNIYTGIKLSDINRNLIFNSNFIYACENGILFDSTCNLHQCNIAHNHISYCHVCVNFYNPLQIANFQITGNDIEIADYPTANKATAKCINITSNSSNVFWGEIEISGNAIQGHGDSESIICIIGDSNKTIDNVSITGNHISNSSDIIYNITNAKSISITGNTYKDVGGYIIQLDGNISYMSVVSETGFGITSGLIHALTTATINGLVSVGCCFDVMTNSIETSSTTNVRLLDT